MMGIQLFILRELLNRALVELGETGTLDDVFSIDD